MCAFFGVSRAAYYEWLRKLEQGDRDQERMEQVQQAYEASHKVYGYRRIALWLRQERQIVMNPKAVLRLMNKLN
jgi:intein-encoded DNA endonuclease-like protein